MNQQETLSRSYTDSISSYLYDPADETHLGNHHHRPASIHSNLSHYNTMGYTTPIIAIAQGRSMADLNDLKLPRRRGSVVTDNDSSYYDSIREEENECDSNSSHHSDENEEEMITPLPKLQMLIVSIILFSEPLTSTILFPFIYFMLKDFHLSDDEKEIGAYAGWITSVFFVAQFSTAIMWGRISDRYGRRPVLLTGLIGNSLSTCLFGLSKNLWWAIGSRALCGIMNGNTGVARSLVSEITDNTNKTKAFSIFGFCWGAGMIGPALGGYLSKPAEHFPSLFGNCQLLLEYPYFLPCFISACGSTVGFVIGYFYLQESNPSVVASKKWEVDQNERTALLRYDTCTSYGKNVDEISSKQVIPKSGSMRHITGASVIVICAYSLFSFHAMVFDEVLPLYFTAPVYAGGLGVTSTDFAKTLSMFGIAQLLFQFGVYPRLTKRFSTLTLCQISFLLFVPIYLLFPELSTFRQWIVEKGTSVGTGGDTGSQNWIFRAGYMSLLLFRFFGNCLAFTSLAVMVSTSAAPEILGTVNGICQSSLSLVRALGPTFGGTLWSISLREGNKFPFDRHLVYYLIGMIGIIGFIQSFAIPKNVALGGSRRRKITSGILE